MSRFRKIFPSRHVVLPVIHAESVEQALRNAEIAREAGCDRVFLINHGMAYRIPTWAGAGGSSPTVSSRVVNLDWEKDLGEFRRPWQWPF